MRALLFPGQGSQKQGMASEFEANFKVVKEIFLEADEALNFDLTKIILNGSDADLKKTEITQPAILATSYAIFTVLKKEYNLSNHNIKFFAGHSLGEYTALVSSGSLKFSDAIKLVHSRGKLMQEAVPEGKGSMLAVMGTEVDELNSFLKNLKKENGICEIANNNSIGQIILSGDKKAIVEVNEILKTNKKRSVLLPVSAPFHCSLMKPAAEKMKFLLNDITFDKPNVTLIGNVDALPIDKKDNIKELLYKQIFSQVRWRESIEYMIKNDVKEFIEIGPGKVLSGLVKRTSDNVEIKNINSIDDIKKLDDRS